MENSSRFFRNTSCAHFPCHPGADPETFNCLFCYCPLYFLPECIGTPRWNAKGVKDCTLCRFPHQPGNYEPVIRKLSEAIRKRAADREATPRQSPE